MKTNYELYRDQKLQDPEFRAKYLLAKEKLNIELMIDSIKEGIEQEKSNTVIKRRLNQLSNYISRLTL